MDPYMVWRKAGGKRPDEIPAITEPDFAVSNYSTELEPAQLPQTARLMHTQLASAGFEARSRMSVARFREVLYLGGENAGRVRYPEHIEEIFAVQGVKRASGAILAVQAHWMGGAFLGGYVHIPGLYHKEVMSEWGNDFKPVLDAIAPKKVKGKK